MNQCIRDADDFGSTIAKIFPLAEVRKLYDLRATKVNIFAGMRWLQGGTPAIMYYSGHGSQVADISGDEIDKLDETIVNIDCNRVGMIRDDEIDNYLGCYNAEIITDCCHSGTNTRMVDELIRVRAIDKGYSSPVEIGKIKDIKGLISWGACQDSEVATENNLGGVFTYNFCKLLRDNPAITRGEIVLELEKSCKQYDQRPNLTCQNYQRDLKIFN